MRRALLLATVLALAGPAWAQDLAALLQTLRQAERLELRGTAEVSVFFPPRAVPTRQQNLLPRVEFVPSLVRRNFDLTQGATETIAGRDAVRFDLTPKAGGADLWTLWLDAEWNVPLAYEERTPDGEVVRRAAFTSVQGPPRRRVASVLPSVRPTLRRLLLTSLPGLRLPGGFEPLDMRLTERGREVVLSDGLNVLVLVITDRGVQAGNGVASRRVDGAHLWIVGNLPQARLRAVVANVRSVDVRTLGTFTP